MYGYFRAKAKTTKRIVPKKRAAVKKAAPKMVRRTRPTRRRR